MAPNGHAQTQPNAVNGQSPAVSSKPWYEEHGREEYRIWQKAHPLNHISYEKWKVSKYVGGLSLYYATLRAFDETDSEDEDVDIESKKRPRSIRDHPAREPRKTWTANGTSTPHDKASTNTTPTTANVAKATASSKKKRKPRKQPKSEEVVASQSDSDDSDVATPATVTPSATPAEEVNGRRKSSQRKPRKKPLSEEIISPEDEEEDPLNVDAVASPAIPSPLPVRAAPGSLASADGPKLHKKTILKLTTRRTPKKKVLSEETVLDDDSNDEPASKTANYGGDTAPKPAITGAQEAYRNVGGEGEMHDVEASPDSATPTSTRRGLRTRRPAQQKPYSLDAQIFEGRSDPPEDSDALVQSPAEPSAQNPAMLFGERKAEAPSLLDAETLAILRGNIEGEYDGHRRPGKPKHFKGKGRAWKKEESDEDLEFEPGQKKHAKPKPKPKAQAGKKRGRPRKSNVSLSEDFIRDDSESDIAAKTDDASTVDSSLLDTPQKVAKRTNRPSRKSALSEEIIVDDSDETDVEMEQDTTNVTNEPTISTPAAKDQEPSLKTGQNSRSVTPSSKHEVTESHTPNSTPPNQSTTPKGEPRSHMIKLKVHVPQHLTDSEPREEVISDTNITNTATNVEMGAASGLEIDDEELCEYNKKAIRKNTNTRAGPIRTRADFITGRGD